MTKIFKPLYSGSRSTLSVGFGIAFKKGTCAGSSQYPILDMIANKVIQKLPAVDLRRFVEAKKPEGSTET